MTNPENSTTDGNESERIPLSLNQEFLCLFDQGPDAGPFGDRYHVVHGWRIRGELDLDALKGALDDVVERHETLRTVIVRDGEVRYQEVLPPCSPELEIREVPGIPPEAREGHAEAVLNEIEASAIDVGTIPHFRALLVRYADDDAVLNLIVHHTATDGWSMRVTIRDYTAYYAARRGHEGPALPPLRSYAEFARWQYEVAATPAAGKAREYWRRKLAGARLSALPTDRPHSAGLPPVTAVHRFSFDTALVDHAKALARKSAGSPFMVLLAAYNLVVQRVTGHDDVVVPTFSPGRGQGRFDDTVGSFFNFIPLRTELAGCRTFRDVLARTRTSCLEAYSHDIPTLQIFGEAPELMAPAMEDGLAPFVFQVFPFPFVLDGERIGDLEYTEIRRRLTSQPVGSDVPDGGLWTLNLDPTGDLIGSLQYRANLYDESTVAKLVTQLRDVLADGLADPDAPLPSP